MVKEQLDGQMGGLAGILFFLLSAMTVVELIDAYGGFDIITAKINRTDERSLVWTVSLIAFFLSPVLDNLTTSIIMVSVLRKLIGNPNQRLVYVGMIIIAVNAGGIWSPMGDVTTTMLWIGNQVSARHLVLTLLLPGLTCLLVPLAICSSRMKGGVRRPAADSNPAMAPAYGKEQYLVLLSGFLVLVSVPLFKMLTGLPPFMGILIGLGILWIITEIIHRRDDSRTALTVATTLQRIDAPSILFLLGILLSGSAAGVAAMGMEKINFLWYLKKITPLALSGFFAGILVYLLQSYIVAHVTS